MEPWTTRFAVQKRDLTTKAFDYRAPKGPAYDWKFIDLETKGNFGSNFYESGAGALKWTGRALDLVAWYYPELALVITELLYKVYNIKLKTQCINVHESPPGINNATTNATISIKARYQPSVVKTYPMGNVNKEAIRADLKNRNFII